MQPRTKRRWCGNTTGFIEVLMDDVAINPSPEGTVIRFAKRLGD